jgi:hypothetical protein
VETCYQAASCKGTLDMFTAAQSAAGGCGAASGKWVLVCLRANDLGQVGGPLQCMSAVWVHGLQLCVYQVGPHCVCWPLPLNTRPCSHRVAVQLGEMQCKVPSTGPVNTAQWGSVRAGMTCVRVCVCVCDLLLVCWSPGMT